MPGIWERSDEDGVVGGGRDEGEAMTLRHLKAEGKAGQGRETALAEHSL